MDTLVASLVAFTTSVSIAAIMLSTIISVLLAAVVLAAKWKIFKKMGEAGWKGLIPVYSEYILFKRVWDAKMFSILLGCFGAYALTGVLATHVTGVALGIITVLCIVSAAVICGIVITFVYRLCKSFGHGVGYTIGYFISEPIMLAVLGFGKSEYVGA